MPLTQPNTLHLHAPRGHALRDIAVVTLSLLAIAAFIAHAMQS
jgi:hypothetical protein